MSVSLSLIGTSLAYLVSCPSYMCIQCIHQHTCIEYIHIGIYSVRISKCIIVFEFNLFNSFCQIHFHSLTQFDIVLCVSLYLLLFVIYLFFTRRLVVSDGYNVRQ